MPRNVTIYVPVSSFGYGAACYRIVFLSQVCSSDVAFSKAMQPFFSGPNCVESSSFGVSLYKAKIKTHLNGFVKHSTLKPVQYGEQSILFQSITRKFF